MGESNSRHNALQANPFPFGVLTIVCPTGIEPVPSVLQTDIQTIYTTDTFIEYASQTLANQYLHTGLFTALESNGLHI